MEPNQVKEIEKAVLKFSNGSTLVEGLQGSVEVAILPNGISSVPLVVVKYNTHLLMYRSAEDGKRWSLMDKKLNVFDAKLGHKKWYLPKQGSIVAINGTRFDTYRLDSTGKKFDQLKHEDKYGGFFLGNFLIGSDLDALVQNGNEWNLMSYKNYTWKQVDVDIPFKNQTKCVIQVINDFNADKDVVLFETENHFGIYKVNEANQMECIARCEQIKFSRDAKYNKIAFANFSDVTEFKDMLHFNTTGLNVYRFNDTTKTYEPHYYSSLFSKFRNWNADHVNSLIVNDVDNNGRDELMFTAPAGFQVFRAVTDDDDFYLEDVILKSVNDKHRFMNLKAILSSCDNGKQCAIFQGDGNLLSMNIESSNMAYTLPLDIQRRNIGPPEIKLITPAAKFSRWLHEQLDLSELLQPLNSLTGRVELSIPLVQLDNPFGISVRKSFQYKDVPGDNCLARGWSLPLDYIVVDPHGSIFEQDFRYAIVRNNLQINLVPNFDKSTDEVPCFEIQQGMILKYFKKEQKWEMEDKEELMTYIFGNHGSLKGLRYSQEDKNKTFPIAWYLVSEKDTTGSFVNYEYDLKEDSPRLRKVSTDQRSLVTFHYEKQKMHKFTVETQFYNQSIFLIYNEDKLTEIKQDGYLLFEFGYESENMVKIVYPNGLTSTFAYKTITYANKQPNELKLLSENFSIHYGPDYSVIVMAASNNSYVQLNVRDVLGGTNSLKTFNTTLSIQEVPFVAYQVMTLENLIGIVRTYQKEKILNVFQYIKYAWKNVQTLFLSSEAIATSNVKSIYIAEPKILQYISIDANETLVTHVQNITKNFVMRATHRGLLTYDDEKFGLRYSPEKQYLKGKFNFYDKNSITETLKTVNRFKLNEDIKTNLIQALKLDMIQIYKNFIILRAVEIRDGIMKIRMRLKILKGSNEIIDSDYWRFELDRVEAMKLNVNSRNGDDCKLGYMWYSDKYAITIDCTGSTVEQFEDIFKAEMEPSESMTVDKIMSAIHTFSRNMASLEKEVSEDNPFAFDVLLLGISADDDGIQTGGKIVSHNGTKWSQHNQDATVDLVLRDKLKLVKKGDADTYKIMNDTTVIYDSETNDSRSVKLIWPHYFVSQSKDGPSLYLFNEKKVKKLTSAEKLSLLSNNLVIVTTADNNTKLMLLPVRSLEESKIDVLAMQTLNLCPNVSRVTSYDNGGLELDGLSNEYIFTSSKILPGANQTKYGWYEHSYDLKTGEMRRSVRNSKGDWIKNIEPEVENEHEKPNSSAVITDKAGRLVVVDVSPLDVEDGEYSYYGFELYERTLFNKTNRWTFDVKNLETIEGKRYLELTDGKSFEGLLNMKRANETYIFACWLRTDTIRKVGDKVSNVKIKPEYDDQVVTVGECKVKHTIAARWYYVEMNITASIPATVIVEVKPETGKRLSVDHVRFSPINVNFRAYMYRQPFWGVSNVMYNNGLMTQYLLDSHGNRVVYVSELGEVTDFITYSKSYFIRNSNKFPHVMEVRPKIGEIECFNNLSRWIQYNQDQWIIQSGTLTHKPDSTDTIERKVSTSCDSFVVRFVYNLYSNDAVVSLSFGDTSIDVLCKSYKLCDTVPSYGEIVVFISKSHYALWFEGTLVSEQSHSLPNIEKFRLTIGGLVVISEMLVLYDPSVKITYYNRLGLPKQTLIMEDQRSVRMKEVVYDEIDRSVITTKWTTVSKEGNVFFGFHENFIKPVRSNQLEGLVNDFNPNCEGYPYFKKDYANSPITEDVIISMPGKVYSKDSKYSRQLTRFSKYGVIEKLFPATHGFTQRVEIRQNKTYHIVVNNVQNQKVAYFIAADKSEERLTTYEYDEEGHLVLELPPMYHSATGTLSFSDPFWEKSLTLREARLQESWGVKYTYNDKGQILSKRMPDSGTEHYIYDDDVIRFLVHKDRNNATDKAVFFLYGLNGQIVKEVLVNITSFDFDQYSSNDTLAPNSNNFIEYYHGEYDENPDLRYRSQQSLRRVDDKHIMESLMFDNANKIVKKIYIVPTMNTSYSIDYEYLNDKLTMIRYPIGVNGSDFKVSYEYNNAGDMISIGTTANPERFIKLQYNADGLVQQMQFEPGSSYSYKRAFSYNEPGYLERINDDFLEETVSYLEDDGYGSTLSMIFEGLISRTAFNAKWHDRSNPTLSTLQLNCIEHLNKTVAEFCIKALQSKGYYNKHLHPLKSFYPKLDDSVSVACRNKQFRAAFQANEFPLYYGHSYDYDSHEQLIRTKYFQSSTEANWKPLTETSFSSIKGVEDPMSKDIWNILTKNDFISARCFNPGMCDGVPGNQSLLNTRIPNFSYVTALILNAISKNETLPVVGFTRRCLRWFESTGLDKHEFCDDLEKYLKTNFMIGEHSNSTLNALGLNLRSVLNSYTEYIPQIVQVLHEHFATRLGESPADVLSCSLDANGNYRLFRQGFDRYWFDLTDGTNQIHTITKTDIQNSTNLFKMKHNGEGSVTVAEHKNITRIEYDLLLNRPTCIVMKDGRMLKFEYDVRGERTFKQVIERDGHVSKEKYYIRELNRNVLVDLQLTYVAKGKIPDVQVTSYIYSDSGLVGFVRNDEFYSVFADHEGSTRLVIKNGEVKAAYDYLPFGIIFRKAEKDLDGAISYLYTGQEWDEETGLYNYHTRLYDPQIGRFYQVDPKSQYASPYVYAGNSPIGLVDPDGQFFMTLIAIALAVVGAYLGAAAANGSWNPAEWNWKSISTWLGIITGAFMGATLPSTAASTLTYLTSTLGLSLRTSVSIMVGNGIGFTYLSMAAANNDWNPENWDKTSPATWNAFFAGVSTSLTIITNPHNLASSYTAITSTVGKGLFVGGKLILTTGFAYMLGVIQQNGEFDPSKWDFTKPGLYMALFNGAVKATGTVNFISNLPKNVKTLIKKISSFLSNKELSNSIFKFNKYLGKGWLKTLLKTPYFIDVNFGNNQLAGKNVFNIFLYTTVCSLRICTIVEKGNVPGFGVLLEVIGSIRKIGSASNHLVSDLKFASKDVAIQPVEVDARIQRPVRSVAHNIDDSEHGSVSSGAPKISRPILNIHSFRLLINGLSSPTENLKEIDIFRTQTSSPNRKTFTISNCFKFKYIENDDAQHIKCFGRRSQFSIHYTTTNDAITQDRFKYCFPLSYNGIPSVSCEGEQSSLLFSAIETPRLFDYTDGWILLARVMPAAIKNIVSGVKGVFGWGRTCFHSKPISEAEINSLITDLDILGDLMEMDVSSEWAQKAVDELREDIVEFLHEPVKNLPAYNILKERVDAVQCDVLEDIEMSMNMNRMRASLGEAMIQECGIRLARDIQSVMERALECSDIVGLLV
ncbi:uncharacterized protein LOC134212602 [Armigeres subalbatus]|uniref:uncharacterized protein LOC134212602 n=1 Tax=Armigeres subalbatus TaxID=124917 RepID=UPI002ED11EE1